MCADIFSGIRAVVRWQDGKPYPGPEIADLESQVKRAMRLFQMKAMIDTLTLYGHRGLDLAARYNRIPAYGANLCLDTVASSLTAGTNTVLADCNGGKSQQWVYDRQTDTIVNATAGLCLDVAWESAVSGQGVGLWKCTGHDSQKWTYNRVTHRLQNKLGTVLDAGPSQQLVLTPTGLKWQSVAPKAGTLVRSNQVTAWDNQEWRAD
jgi:hypothetical protein